MGLNEIRNSCLCLRRCWTVSSHYSYCLPRFYLWVLFVVNNELYKNMRETRARERKKGKIKKERVRECTGLSTKLLENIWNFAQLYQWLHSIPLLHPPSLQSSRSLRHLFLPLVRALSIKPKESNPLAVILGISTCSNSWYYAEMKFRDK